MLPILSPSQFVDLFNQSLELTLPIVEIEGEITNLRISRGRWIYFDIADSDAKVKCFGAVYSTGMPLEDGMTIKLVAVPRLHKLYGLSLNISQVSLVGEGAIKKSADLLRQKLEKENLFSPERKRRLPYPPKKIGLVTSVESAAYRDFVKVLGERFGGIEIDLVDVLVQGQAAPAQIIQAVDWFSAQAEPVEVLVIIRGGGSADDLQAFNTEQVTRAVAASRVPTMVAIGHESDVLLAELAADLRASTPSNAAELLVPDKKDILSSVASNIEELFEQAISLIESDSSQVRETTKELHQLAESSVDKYQEKLSEIIKSIDAMSPDKVLRQGYAIVKSGRNFISQASDLNTGDRVEINFNDGSVKAKVE